MKKKKKDLERNKSKTMMNNQKLMVVQVMKKFLNHLNEMTKI